MLSLFIKIYFNTNRYLHSIQKKRKNILKVVCFECQLNHNFSIKVSWKLKKILQQKKRMLIQVTIQLINYSLPCSFMPYSWRNFPLRGTPCMVRHTQGSLWSKFQTISSLIRKISHKWMNENQTYELERFGVLLCFRKCFVKCIRDVTLVKGAFMPNNVWKHSTNKKHD